MHILLERETCPHTVSLNRRRTYCQIQTCPHTVFLRQKMYIMSETQTCSHILSFRQKTHSVRDRNTTHTHKPTYMQHKKTLCKLHCNTKNTVSDTDTQNTYTVTDTLHLHDLVMYHGSVKNIF